MVVTSIFVLTTCYFQ